jgi:hypothetical protein
MKGLESMWRMCAIDLNNGWMDLGGTTGGLNTQSSSISARLADALRTEAKQQLERALEDSNRIRL